MLTCGLMACQAGAPPMTPSIAPSAQPQAPPSPAITAKPGFPMRRLAMPAQASEVSGTPVAIRLVGHSASSAPEGPKRISVHRTIESLTTALSAAGLLTGPSSARFHASIDFATETAILVDLGYAGGVGGQVTPVSAHETPEKVLVRYTVPTPEAALPAVNHPYGILAIPATNKPVVVEALSDQEMLGTALKGLSTLPVPEPTAIPSPRTYAVTGSSVTVPGTWIVWKQEAPADWLGQITRLAISSPTDSPESGASLTIESLPVTSPLSQGKAVTVDGTRQSQAGQISWPPLSWRTGVFDEPWLGSVGVLLRNGQIDTMMTRFHFPVGAKTYDRLTLTYRTGALSEAEALTILQSWQPTPDNDAAKTDP
jgi:hypothetical protein